MASHRATSHVAYNKFFQPLVREFLRRREAQVPLDQIVATLPKGKAIEMRARFYTWRKFLTEWCTKCADVATEFDMQCMSMAEEMTVKINRVSETEFQVIFCASEHEEWLKLLARENELRVQDMSEHMRAATVPQAKPTNMADMVAAVQAAIDSPQPAASRDETCFNNTDLMGNFESSVKPK